MKTRRSFFIRWLKTFDSSKNELSVIDVEHIQSGETWRVSSIEEAAETMRKADNCTFIEEQPLTTSKTTKH